MRLSNLALTCITKSSKNPIESQLQKIATVYALSRFLDVSYFHTPPSLSCGDTLAAQAKTARCHQLFNIKSDLELPQRETITYQLPTASLDFLCNLRNEALQHDSFFIVELTSARGIAEQHPEMLRYVKEISPFEPSSSPLFRIAMHVRQADLLEPEKMLSHSFYTMMALRTIELLQQAHIPFVCELHAEIPSAFSTSSTDQQKQFDLLTKDVFKKFESLPQLQKSINSDPIDSLQSLATADVLILSRYSLSYFAALLNKKGVIIHHPFLEYPLQEWIHAAHFDLFHQKIEEKILHFKKIFT